MTGTDPTCSVVIPTYNAAATLGDQLEALTRQAFGGPFEVVVADNGSTDGSAAVAASYTGRLPLLRVVDASRGRGVSVARNEGVRAASADLLLLCDADDVVEDGWLAAMVAALGEHDFVGGVLDTSHSGPTASWVPFPRRTTRLPRVWRDRPYAYGGNCGFRRAVFDDAGGFDESYPAGAEEIDFALRAAAHGHIPVLVPDAVVRYRIRSDLRGVLRQQFSSGLGTAQLYDRFAPPSVPTRSWRGRLRHQVALLRHLPVRGSGADRRRWLGVMAFEAGVVRGALRHRRRMP